MVFRSIHMGSFSVWHWLIVLAVVLLLFGGRGKISALMGDFGKGLSAFKKGVSGDGADKDAAQAGPAGDSAKPISAQTTTSSPQPGAPGQHRQGLTAAVRRRCSMFGIDSPELLVIAVVALSSSARRNCRACCAPGASGCPRCAAWRRSSAAMSTRWCASPSSTR
jgi:sec-independent protein translocase protein TatA